jgi:hypothetical protein
MKGLQLQRICNYGPPCSSMRIAVTLCLFVAVVAGASRAQERPYFVTYSHEMEEPGNLDIEIFSVIGKPPAGNRFIGGTIEFGYGVTA